MWEEVDELAKEDAENVKLYWERMYGAYMVRLTAHLLCGCLFLCCAFVCTALKGVGLCVLSTLAR